jgi:hypothetical protein
VWLVNLEIGDSMHATLLTMLVSAASRFFCLASVLVPAGSIDNHHVANYLWVAATLIGIT